MNTSNDARSMVSNPADENQNCDQTYASFRVVGDRLTPDEVTAATGITPTISHAKGQIFQSRGGDSRWMTGVWAISSQGKVDSTSLERHIAYLAGRRSGPCSHRP